MGGRWPQHKIHLDHEIRQEIQKASDEEAPRVFNQFVALSCQRIDVEACLARPCTRVHVRVAQSSATMLSYCGQLHE